VLNIGQLQEKDLAILIQNNMCKLFHQTRGLIMEIAITANRMFIMLAAISPKKPVAFFQTSEDGET